MRIATPLRRWSTSDRFRRLENLDKPVLVRAWWEGRRLFFNTAVGTAGLVTMAACVVSAGIGEAWLHTPIGVPDPPIFGLFGVVAYGIAANVCYTGGWIAESIALRLWGSDKSNPFGEVAFALGVCFSIALTLAPIVLLAVAWCVLLATAER